MAWISPLYGAEWEGKITRIPPANTQLKEKARDNLKLQYVKPVERWVHVTNRLWQMYLVWYLCVNNNGNKAIKRMKETFKAWLRKFWYCSQHIAKLLKFLLTSRMVSLIDILRWPGKAESMLQGVGRKISCWSTRMPLRNSSTQPKDHSVEQPLLVGLGEPYLYASFLNTGKIVFS